LDLKPSKHDVHKLRAAAVAEAFSWLNTPYVDCGYVKGPRGAVDCAMLLIGIYSAVGIVPKDYDPRPYNPDWHLHQNEELYMAGLERYSKRVDMPEIGDILMYKFGRHASHGAVLVSDEYIIHAHKRDRCVVLCEKRAMSHWFHSYWSPF
jgi:cell wall-associated NlpC family hydrolase